MQARRFIIDGITVNLYFDANAFDLLITPDNEIDKKTYIENLIALTCQSVSQDRHFNGINPGSLYKAFYIDSALISNDATTLHLVYHDDSHHPQRVKLSTNNAANTNYQSDPTFRPPSDNHLIAQKNKSSHTIQELILEQQREARGWFQAGNIPATFPPPTTQTMLDKQQPFIKAEVDRISAASIHVIQNSALSSIDKKMAVLESEQQKLRHVQTNLGNNITRHIAEMDLRKFAPNERAQVRKKIRTFMESCLHEPGQNLQERVVTLDTQQEELRDIKNGLIDKSDKVKNEIQNHTQQSMLVKANLLHVLHLAAQESYELLRQYNTNNREELRHQFNIKYAGIAHVTDIGKLIYHVYQGEEFLQLPLAKVKEKVNELLIRTEPSTFDRIFHSDNPNDHEVLTKHLLALGANFFTNAHTAQLQSQQEISNTAGEFKKVAQEGASLMNITHSDQATAAVIEQTITGLKSAQSAATFYALFLQHKATVEMNIKQAQLVLAEVLELQANLENIVAKFPPESASANVANMHLKTVQQNSQKIFVLIENMEKIKQDIYEVANLDEEPTQNNIHAWHSNAEELAQRTGALLNRNKGNSINDLYESSMEAKIKINEQHHKLNLTNALPNLRQQLAKLQHNLSELSIQAYQDIASNIGGMQKSGYIIRVDQEENLQRLQRETNLLLSAFERKTQELGALTHKYELELNQNNSTPEYLSQLNMQLSGIEARHKQLELMHRKFAVNFNEINSLNSQIAEYNQNTLQICQSVISLANHVEHWSKQVVLLGGSSIGDQQHTRVPTGIAKIMKKIAEYDRMDAQWRDNPILNREFLNAVKVIAAERIPKQTGVHRFKLFIDKNTPDKDSTRFYKMLVNLDFDKMGQTDYSQAWHAELAKKFNMQTEQTTFTRKA